MAFYFYYYNNYLFLIILKLIELNWKDNILFTNRMSTNTNEAKYNQQQMKVLTS